MKKVFGLVLAVSMMTGLLAGCGEQTTNAVEGKHLSTIDVEKYVTKLPEYKGIELTKTATKEITDEAIDIYIEYMMASAKEAKEVTGRAIQEGDIANIDFVGTKDGEAFEGGTAEAFDLEIGSGQFIEGFEEGLIGLNVGDEVDLDLKFPEDYHSEDLAGKPVVFHVTVNKISEMVQQELDDAYVMGLGLEGVSTVADFRDFVKKTLEETAEQKSKEELYIQVTDFLMEQCEFADNTPERILNYYKDMIRKNFETNAQSANMELNDFITTFYGMSVEAFEEELTTAAKNNANQALACAVIAKKEGITVSKKEMKEYAEANYMNFGFASAKEYLESELAADYSDYLLTMKVLDFLVENAVITEKTPEEIAAEAETEVVEETTAEAVGTEAAETEEATTEEVPTESIAE